MLLGEASNILDLLFLGIAHAPKAVIKGEGLQSLQNDPSVKKAQSDIINDYIVSDPDYGKRPLSITISGPEDFSANGPSEDWRQDAVKINQGALEINQAFFMVHTGNLYATNTKVSADGTITTTWRVEDQFDYLPAWNDHNRTGAQYWIYNLTGQFFYQTYHLGLNALPFPTTATWTETRPPIKD